MLLLRVSAYEVAGKIHYDCSFFPLVVVMRHSTLPFPFAKAMDVTTQVLFSNMIASFTNGMLENAELHYIAFQLKVTPYDCGEMTDSNLYALNQVSKCNIAPGNLEASETFPKRNRCNSLLSQLPKWTMVLWFWRRFTHGCPSRRDNNRFNYHRMSMQIHEEFQPVLTQQDVQQNWNLL